MASGENHIADAAAYEASFSSSKRDLLLRRLADLAVLPPGRMTPQERSLIDTVMASAVARLDLATRHHLAVRIAQLPEGPPELTLALARDRIDVAAPVLRGCPGLQSSDLVQIIRDGGPEHQLAISERKILPGAVVDALIDYAKPDALCRMLANPTAELSSRAMEILVRRSATETAFQPLLMARAELTTRLAQSMFWWVGPETRRDILTRHSIERRMMYAALDGVLEPGFAAAETDDALRVTLSRLRPPFAMPKTRLTRLVDMSARYMREEFTAELALAGRIRHETAFQIVNDPGGEALAVFAKANGFARSEFSELVTAVFKLRMGEQPRDEMLERIIAVFDAISIDRADQVLHSWDWSISAETSVLSDS